ncbi:hypothetical protein ACVWYG_000041 [Pedobacter sp. UYEF25]
MIAIFIDEMTCRDLIKNFDFLANQEMVDESCSLLVVAKLADAVNWKGAKWNYMVVNDTSVNSREQA